MLEDDRTARLVSLDNNNNPNFRSNNNHWSHAWKDENELSFPLVLLTWHAHGPCVNTPNFGACGRGSPQAPTHARIVASCVYSPKLRRQCYTSPIYWRSKRIEIGEMDRCGVCLLKGEYYKGPGSSCRFEVREEGVRRKDERFDKFR